MYCLKSWKERQSSQIVLLLFYVIKGQFHFLLKQSYQFLYQRNCKIFVTSVKTRQYSNNYLLLLGYDLLNYWSLNINLPIISCVSYLKKDSFIQILQLSWTILAAFITPFVRHPEKTELNRETTMYYPGPQLSQQQQITHSTNQNVHGNNK